MSKPRKVSVQRSHGLARRNARHPLYATWRNMITRCYNPKNHSFKYWGEKGIGVCDRWRFGENGLTAFECFLLDVGDRPFAGASLDRITSSIGYSKENCRWATAAEQSRNRSNSRLTSEMVSQIKKEILAGARSCELAKRFNVGSTTISNIKSGFSWSDIPPSLDQGAAQ